MYSKKGQDEYLITIENKEHKIVKYISGQQIKKMKVIYGDRKNPQKYMLLLTQLHEIKRYLKKINQHKNIMQIDDMLRIQQKYQQGVLSIIKVHSKFIEQPTLYHYFTIPKFKDTHQVMEQKHILYYYEEMFKIMVKEGGIPNYFYTAHNIHIEPLSINKLILNYTSTVGVRFLFLKQNSMLEQQFRQIFPCLPPDTFMLMENNKIDRLNLKIKVRSFGFNALLFIIKRVPQLLEENLPPLVQVNSPEIRDKIQNSQSTFKTLLKLIEKELRKFEEKMKIRIEYLLELIFVKNQVQSWQTVYQIMFLQNHWNLGSQLRRNITRKQFDYLRYDLFYSDQIAALIWRSQSEVSKKYWQSVGIATKNGGRLYLLVKIGRKFHFLLRHSNIVELLKSQSFNTIDTSITTRLVQLLLQGQDKQTVKPKLSFQSKKEVQVYLQRVIKGNTNMNQQFTTPAQPSIDLFNPILIDKNKQIIEHELSQIETLSSISSFFQNINTYNSIRHQEQHKIKIVTKQWQRLSQFQNNLWIL